MMIMTEIELKITEIPQQHVGKGRAILDPKILEDTKWGTGQILELTYNKKTHVKLWPGSPEDYGTGTIKIDGITRHNIGAGIGDKIKIVPVEASDAEQISLSPTEKLSIDECLIIFKITYLQFMILLFFLHKWEVKFNLLLQTQNHQNPLLLLKPLHSS